MCDVQELLRLRPAPSPGTVRFFKKGGMFYAIEKDAEEIASKHLRSIGSLKDSNNGSGRYVSISEVLYASLLRELLLYNRRSIELFEFDRDTWTKTVEASPGNITPVIDLINNDLDISNASMLLAVSGKMENNRWNINAACCDATLFTIATTEYMDESSFCYFETLLTQIMPSEIVFAKSGNDESFPPKELVIIADKFGIPYKNGTMNKGVDVGKFPKTNSVKTLLSSLQLNLSEFEHKPFQLLEFMTVDYSASNALNIFPEGNQTSRGLPTSLYQLLNECVTPMGSRLLHQNMQQPLLDQQKIQERLDIVEAFTTNLDVTMTVRDAIKQLPDIPRLIRKLLSGRGNLQDCVRIYDIASVAPRLSVLGDIELEPFQHFLETIESIQAEISKARELVAQTIDFSALPQHIYRISPDFDEDLTEVNEKMRAIKKKMEKHRSNIANDLGIEDEKMKLELSANKQSYYFRVTKMFDKNLRSTNVKVIETRQNGVHFTTAVLSGLVDDYFSLDSEYSKKQKEIAKQLISSIAEFHPVFQKFTDLVSLIDFYTALAMVASNSSFVKPQMTPDSSEILLEEARHPLVEKHVSFQPNSVEMKRGESSFMIISGPNSAGKSTLLKTVGCCVYLAHVGSFVPANSATIPITSSIHARVGAWDSAQMSTFTVEMTEMAGILQSAHQSSLILVDELGRSTSCSDGFGLAWAISKHLATIGSFTLFATHFHELCNLENEIPSVVNYHMKVNTDEGLLMLYQLVKGRFPKSFGIDAAQRAGFPPSVIKRSMEKAIELEQADGEGEAPKRIRIDPNEPNVNFLRKLLQIDLMNQTPGQVVQFVQKSFDEYNEEVKANPVFA